MKSSPLDGSNVSDEGFRFYSITWGAEDAESNSRQQSRSSTPEVRPSLLQALQAPPLSATNPVKAPLLAAFFMQINSNSNRFQVKMQQKQQSAKNQDRHVR